jgi:hypothetical protein
MALKVQSCWQYKCLAWIIHELRSLQRRGSSPRSCSDLPQADPTYPGYNEGFVVRSARP